MAKTVIIGDVHGCHEELARLLKKVDLDEKDDVLIFIGDLIDRGPDPYLTVETARNLRKSMGGRCVIIRGNHEQMLLDGIYDISGKDLWKFNGGNRTIRSFYRHGKRYEMLREWVSSLPFYYEADAFTAVHAGTDASGPDGTSEDVFLWDRKLADDGDYSGKLAIYGHTPMENALYQDGLGNKDILKDGMLYQLPATGSICLDTGCVFCGKLTAMVIESNSFVLQSVRSKSKKNCLI